MTLTIPYVRDLRMTAATIAAQHITAGWHGRSEAVPYAVVETALDAVAPLLIDAWLIEAAMEEPDERTEGDPYRYLVGLQRKGDLKLRTLEVDEDDAAVAAVEPK